MKRMTVPLFLLLVATAWVLAVPAVALAGESHGAVPVLAAAEEPADEGAEPGIDPGGPQPAEVAPAPEAEDDEQPWTTRFLVPTFLALAVLGFVASVVYYAVRVLGRYRVVR